MGTIKETYVSFEIASLLNEKGFDEECRARYDSNGALHYEKYPIEASGAEMHDSILCPTHQMVMMWLREVYNILIEPESVWDGKKLVYQLFVVTPQNAAFAYDEHNPYKSYEECVEAGIKYCLEKKLIF